MKRSFGRDAICLAFVLGVLSPRPLSAFCQSNWVWNNGHHTALEDGTTKILFGKEVEEDGKKYREVTKVEGGDYKNAIKDRIPLEKADDWYKNCNIGGTFPDWAGRHDASLTAETQQPARSLQDLFPATSARTIDAADLNGDGEFDTVESEFRPAGVYVQLSRPGGGLDTAQYETEANPEAILLRDVNNDGVLDLVGTASGDFINSRGGLFVLIGSPGGTFAPAVRYEAGIGARGLAVEDFNGDGNPDAVVATSGSLGAPALPADPGELLFLPGGRDGTFGAAVRIRQGGQPRAVLAVDLGENGSLELVVAYETEGALEVLASNGNGTFTQRRQIDVGARPSYLGSTDLNGDGRRDLVVLHGRLSVISTWFGAANGDFQPGGRYLAGLDAESFEILHGENPRPIIFCPDVTKDRILTLAANLDGTLTGPRSFLTGEETSGVAAGDFDGDGRADVAVSSRRELTLLSNVHGAGEPPSEALLEGASLRLAHVVAADFDGDGRTDLAAAHADGRISVLMARAGGFQPARAFNAGDGPQRLAVGDLNADGDPDLVSANDESVTALIGDGAGGFAATTYPGRQFGRSVAIGDVTGDGRDDVAAAFAGDFSALSGGVALYRSQANGTLGAAEYLDGGFSPVSVAIGDFNADGRNDIAVSGQLLGAPQFLFGVRILLNNGGGFTTAPDLETEFGPGNLAAADVDRDGFDDLVVAHCCGQTDMTLLFGNGDGTFRPVSFAGGTDPQAVDLADLDGDDDLDLVLAGSGLDLPGVVSVLTNSFSAFVTAPATGGAAGAVAPDSIVSAYGAGLATSIAAAETPDWPQQLAGTQVSVTDALGAERPSSIAFTSPGQVNFHLAAGTAPGVATVTIRSGGRTLSAPLAVEPVMPGLFQVREDGLAAAWVIRVKPSGEQILEPVIRVDSQGRLQPAIISLTDPGDTLVLQVFGTGIRGNGGPGAVQATIDGEPVRVLYAGPQNQFPGFDQVNLEITRNLANRGLVEILLTVDGVDANPLRVLIR